MAASCLGVLVLLGVPGARPRYAGHTGPGDPWLGALPAPPTVPREFRAAWVTPVEGGEWPSRPGLDSTTQQAELRALLERARAVGLNAIILHVRPAADAFYPTPLAPWSRYLVGRDDALPGYDPLAFAVREAHARGLQLHVWFNPFRAAPPDADDDDGGEPAANDIRRVHPEWVRSYGDVTWIDPGIPAARQAVLDAILDVVQRYDIDGVHLDDYFYPYLEERTVTRTVGRGRRRRRVRRTVTLRFPDDASWARYGAAGGWTDRADWRRANISGFVQALYQEVKVRKPWVLVGISPFGIWRSGTPSGVTGLDAYNEIFADSREWLRRGWVDYLAPQLYWPLDGNQQRFTRLDAWWRTQNPLGRHVWPGLLSMRTQSENDPWPPGEVASEITELRSARAGSAESLGHVHFRLRTLIPDGAGSLGDILRRTTYTSIALPPASPWLGAARPTAPRLDADDVPLAIGDFVLTGGSDLVRFAAAAGDTVPVRWWIVQTLARDGRWSTAVLPADSTRVRIAPGDDAPAAIAVRAVSRTGVIGPASVFRYAPPLVRPYATAPHARGRTRPHATPRYAPYAPVRPPRRA